MSTSKTVIATTTFYRDEEDVRAKLALQFADEAEKAGYQLVVVDGGSPTSFVSELNFRGAMVMKSVTPGMGSDRRQAMAKAITLAGDGGVVIWSEPEKHTLVRELGHVASPVLLGRSDLVIPKRSYEGLLSYPPEQLLAERMGNLAFKYLTGKDLDIWFGVFAANKRALRYFLEYNGEHGDLWDSTILPRVQAIKEGIRVESVNVKYTHPVEQTEQETGDMGFFMKRIDQLRNLVPALQKEAAKYSGEVALSARASSK